jgi:hypothetical protein
VALLPPAWPLWQARATRKFRRNLRQKHFCAEMFRRKLRKTVEVYMTLVDFEAELQRLAEAEYQAWRDYSLRRAELEAAKAEAAEALLDGDTPAARRKFSDATQALALLEASVDAARHRRQKLFAAYCEARVTELRTRARELQEQAKSIDTERRKFLDEIEKLEAAKFFDPPITEYDAPRKSDLLRAEAEDLLAAAARLERAGIPRAGVACGSNLEELLSNMLKTPSIPPSCEAVAEWYRTLAAAVPRGHTPKFARIAWRNSRLVRDGSYLETDRGYWLYVREDGTIGEHQATRALADLPAPTWMLEQAWHFSALTK